MAVLYCFAIGLYSGVAYAGNTAFSKQTGKESAGYSQVVAAKSFQHTVQTENSLTVCTHSNPVSVKNTHNDFSAVNIAAAHVFVHSFSQYNFFAHKLLVRLQNTDLIFPFHYFW